MFQYGNPAVHYLDIDLDSEEVGEAETDANKPDDGTQGKGTGWEILKNVAA